MKSPKLGFLESSHTPMPTDQAVKPIKPAKPLKPVNPLKPIKPVSPGKPVQPVKPAKPIKPLKPIKQEAQGQRWYTIAELATELGITEAAVRRRIQYHRIPTRMLPVTTMRLMAPLDPFLTTSLRSLPHARHSK